MMQAFHSFSNWNGMLVLVIIAISDHIFEFANFKQVGFTVSTSIRTSHTNIVFDFMSFYPAISIDIQNLVIIMFLKA